MATLGGPNIETDGLVFGYDTGYPIVSGSSDTYRFNLGEPTENLITENGLNFTQFSSYGDLSRVQVADTNSPSGYACEMEILDGDNINPAARIAFGDNTNMPSSGTAMVSIYVKFEGGPTSNIAPYVYNGSGTAWQQLLPLDGGSNYLTSEYRRFGVYAAITANPGFSMAKGNSNNQTGQKVRWHSPQVTLKPHATPFTTGTRSVSGSLLDLKGNTDIDLSNVSFDSNAQMTFDGTDDLITVTGYKLSTTDGTQPYTIEAIIKRGGGSSTGGIVTQYRTSANAPDRFGFREISSGYLSWWKGGNIAISNSTMPTGVYLHIVGTRAADSSVTIYQNGEVVGSGTDARVFEDEDIQIGSFGSGIAHFDGEIPVVKIYNRALTPSEVLQNFKAYKNRFNL